MEKTEQTLRDVINELQPSANITGEIDWDTCIEAMKRFGKQKWSDGCEKTLSNIALTFIDDKNINKAERESDKDVFLAIGETIKNFPKPEYE